MLYNCRNTIPVCRKESVMKRLIDRVKWWYEDLSPPVQTVVEVAGPILVVLIVVSIIF